MEPEHLPLRPPEMVTGKGYRTAEVRSALAWFLNALEDLMSDEHISTEQIELIGEYAKIAFEGGE